MRDGAPICDSMRAFIDVNAFDIALPLLAAFAAGTPLTSCGAKRFGKTLVEFLA
jgi:hypothetical protein